MNFNEKAVDSFPKQLKDEGRFCLWKYEDRNGRRTKIPYNPKTGNKAQSNNPESFSDLQTAVSQLSGGDYDGIGIGFFGDMVGIDIDHCIDENGEYSELANTIMDLCKDFYIEKSPSGTGVHILCSAHGLNQLSDYKKKYLENNRGLGLEVYVAGITNRYFTLTLNFINNYIINRDGSQEVRIVLDRYMKRQTGSQNLKNESGKSLLSDVEIIEKAEAASNGMKFAALYEGNYGSLYQSDSEAVIALLNMLAFWSNRDAETMNRLFQKSGLYSEKLSSRPALMKSEIQKAIDGTSEVYNPEFKQMPVLTSTGGGMLEKIQQLKPEKSSRYTWDDAGISLLFADIIVSKAKYVCQRKSWYIFDGEKWCQDEDSSRISKMCREFTSALIAYSETVGNEEYIKYAKKQRAFTRREHIVKDAKSEHITDFGVFDSKPYLFNCRNGTFDLSSMTFREHQPEDMLTQMSNVEYISAAKCERWEQFISEIFEGDKEKARYFQKALGYTLTGSTEEECMFILYGPSTRNGKGTAMGTFLHLLGDYGKKANSETIATKSLYNGSNHSEDVARLNGARFCNISEPAKNLHLSADLIKEMTGGDPLTARFLYEKSFEYKPQFKIFMDTNYLPSTNDTSLFSSKRVKVVPFNRHFEPEEQDLHLKATLAQPESISGVFNWCLEGLKLYRQEGLKMPASIVEACQDYEMESDKTAQFLEDATVQDSNESASVTDLYTEYTVWCSRNGNRPENKQNFRKGLLNHGEIKRIRPHGRNSKQVTSLIGYRLIPGNDFYAI